MYALRRTVVAFLLGALLFGAPVVVAVPPHVHTLAQVLVAGNDAAGQAITGLSDLLGTNDLDQGSTISITAGYATANNDGVGGGLNLTGGFNNGGGAPAAVYVAGSQGHDGGYLDLHSGNGYPGSGGNISLYPGQPNGLIILNNLPTTDPAVAGALWSDNGTVRVSAG